MSDAEETGMNYTEIAIRRAVENGVAAGWTLHDLHRMFRNACGRFIREPERKGIARQRDDTQ